MREKLFRLVGDELPYTSTVLIEKFEQEGDLRRMFAAILVERDTHKSMVIGNKGARLKEVSTQARLDMEKLFGGPVYLEIWVKVKIRLGRQRSGSARLRLRVSAGISDAMSTTRSTDPTTAPGAIRRRRRRVTIRRSAALPSVQARPPQLPCPRPAPRAPARERTSDRGSSRPSCCTAIPTKKPA